MFFRVVRVLPKASGLSGCFRTFRVWGLGFSCQGVLGVLGNLGFEVLHGVFGCCCRSFVVQGISGLGRYSGIRVQSLGYCNPKPCKRVR